MTTETTAAPAHAKICPECGELFETTHTGKVFCGEPCRVSYANTSLSRGKTLAPLVVTWRRHRTSETGKRALRELCRIASIYIEEDRVERRDSAIQLEALWSGFHLSKFDRPARKPKPPKARAADQRTTGE